MSAFIIGQKVMCIKGWRYKGRRFNQPKFMQIYTVRAHCPCADIPSILLEGLHNCEVRFIRTLKVGEASFAESHFAPFERLSESKELETVA